MTRRAGIMVMVWVALLAITAGARAESVFGLNLVGMRIDSGDVRAIALGGGFQLLDDSLGVGQSNPAMLAQIRRVTFSATQYFGRDTNKSETLQATDGSVKFTNFTFAFSVLDGFNLAVGYRARYDADGEFVTRMTTDSGERYFEEFTRRGGLFAFPFQAALDLGRIKLGGYFAFENGSFDNQWTMNFATLTTLDAFSKQSRAMSATSFGGAAVLRPWRRLALGVIYESKIEYDVDVTVTNSNTSANASYSNRMVVPERWTGQVQAWPTRRLGLYAAGSISDFTKFEGLSFPPERLAREEIGQAGIEYLNALGRYPLRLGAVYERLPYTLPDGTRVTTLLFSIGTGLKFSDSKGKIDITLQAGRMGSVGSNTFETQVVRLYVGIGGSEIWKRRRIER